MKKERASTESNLTELKSQLTDKNVVLKLIQSCCECSMLELNSKRCLIYICTFDESVFDLMGNPLDNILQAPSRLWYQLKHFDLI